MNFHDFFLEPISNYLFLQILYQQFHIKETDDEASDLDDIPLHVPTFKSRRPDESTRERFVTVVFEFINVIYNR